MMRNDSLDIAAVGAPAGAGGGEAGGKRSAPGPSVLEEARFPMGLCLAQIALTSLGLVAAAIGMRWGAAAQVQSDSFEMAWLYVNVLATLGSMTLWPGVAMARYRGPREPDAPLPYREQLQWDLSGLVLGAMPAMGTAAFLSAIDGMRLGAMLALQGGFTLFTMGLLMCCWGRQRWQVLAAALLAGLVAAAPVGIYFWEEFFARAPDQWIIASPMLAVWEASKTGAGVPVTWWIAGTYALLGLALAAMCARE